jgi:hypothetical protein
MSDPTEWIKDLVPPEDVAQMEATAKKILNADTTVYEMSIMMTQTDMVQVIRAATAMQDGDKEAWMMGISILMALVATMEDALQQDGIKYWED